MDDSAPQRTFAREWFGRAVALVAPPRCAICSGPTDAGRATCERCIDALDRAPAGIDRSDRGGGCDRVFASHDFSGVTRDAVHALKYSGRTALASTIAEQMVRRLPSTRLLDSFALVPVPAHPANARQRGFNQSLLIATELGKLLHAPVWDCLVRAGRRPPQSQLNRSQRLLLPAGEFAFEPRRSRHQRAHSLAELPTNVVVCDDVTTTTCTLEACASAIRERCNVQTIHGLTFASASRGASL